MIIQFSMVPSTPYSSLIFSSWIVRTPSILKQSWKRCRFVFFPSLQREQICLSFSGFDLFVKRFEVAIL
uniref:Uncharacterized protein n=1 Tax=Lepeophtheirus salmonis TaxID=72036 RepID=A0A0K2US79_LEPSM